VRYALNRLWNPRTEKGLLATLRKGGAVKLVADILSEADKFFDNVEAACEEIQKSAGKTRFGGESSERRRAWTELRIRRAELVKDNVTLPIQRLREAVSELIKLSEDKDIGQELWSATAGSPSCALRSEGVSRTKRIDHVYWVERGGKAHKIFRSTPRRLMWRNSCAAVVRERHEHHHDQRDFGLARPRVRVESRAGKKSLVPRRRR
jgi:ATP-dependent DNA helicase DinG